ncbi:MAG: substrate-binding domain-containing protein [Blautia sp.]|nr:substrate-binding domain-containing protein [Blautia sp.]
MKRKLAFALLGVSVGLMLLSSCGKKNEAAKAAAESEETEKAGNGEDTEGESGEQGESGEEAEELVEPDRIAILLPGNYSDGLYSADVDVMSSEFREAGYQTVVCWAGGDRELQSRQVSEAVSDNTVAMIISPEDPYGLTDAIEEVHTAGIPVFDYDELIMNTDKLKFFITFDNREAGHQMAKHLEEELSLDKRSEDDEPYRIGYMIDTQKVSGLFAFNGLLEELQKYYESGVLIPLTGENYYSGSETAAMNASDISEITGAVAEKESGSLMDIVCLSGDERLEAVMEAAGSVPEDTSSSVDADMKDDTEGSKGVYIFTDDINEKTAQAVVSGTVNAAVFRDRRSLASECVKTVTACLSDEDPEEFNYGDYDNGIRTVKAITCPVEIIDDENYTILIDKGWITEEELNLNIEIPEESTEPASGALPEEASGESAEDAPDGSRGENSEETPESTTEASQNSISTPRPGPDRL